MWAAGRFRIQTLTRQSSPNVLAGSVKIPGLDCGAPYTSRLSARSALYTEFHLLLDGQSAALPLREYRGRVVDDNCLSRSSASARQKLWMELKNRYGLDARDPLFGAFWIEWKRCLSEPERQLTAYILFASGCLSESKPQESRHRP
jgi:hypothetical protein